MAVDRDFKEMLSYMRPEGSLYQKKFCNRYLKPVFGKPDRFGNYTKIVGNDPTIAFMAHHDTVHFKTGRQEVKLASGFYTTVDGSCLGADCTTGVYIILKMIEANVPGVYVVHAGEEIGCIGSSALVKSQPKWFGSVKAAISFDRKGYDSVITHQMGMRTCSDEFANSLADILGLAFETDNGGAYTDSNEYVDDIGECTNLSVGYFAQHSKAESQDKVFLDLLINKLIAADWNKLVFSRQPGDVDADYESYYNHPWKGYRGWNDLDDSYGMNNTTDKTYTEYYPAIKGAVKIEDEYEANREEDQMHDMAILIKENPLIIAKIFQDLGYDAYDLIDDIQDYEAEIKPSRGYRRKN